MKKITYSLVLLALLIIPTVIASREEDRATPISNFKVYKWISAYAPDEVAVLTVNSGERGYVVISTTTEDKYARGIEIAKRMIKTSPNQIHGTKFSYITIKI